MHCIFWFLKVQQIESLYMRNTFFIYILFTWQHKFVYNSIFVFTSNKSVLIHFQVQFLHMIAISDIRKRRKEQFTFKCGVLEWGARTHRNPWCLEKKRSKGKRSSRGECGNIPMPDREDRVFITTTTTSAITRTPPKNHDWILFLLGPEGQEVNMKATSSPYEEKLSWILTGIQHARYAMESDEPFRDPSEDQTSGEESNACCLRFHLTLHHQGHLAYCRPLFSSSVLSAPHLLLHNTLSLYHSLLAGYWSTLFQLTISSLFRF